MYDKIEDDNESNHYPDFWRMYGEIEDYNESNYYPDYWWIYESN